MRLEQRIALDTGRIALLRELRVRDVLNLERDPGLAELGRLIEGGDWIEWDGGRDLSEPEAIQIWEAFAALNGALFGGGRPFGDPGAGFANVRRNCLILVERGHPNVFDYGWSFFLSALKFANQ